MLFASLQKTNRAGEPEWSEAIIKPFSDYDLYIADEAYR